MTLALLTTALAADWDRAVRRRKPTRRWAAADPAIPANPDRLMTTLRDWYGPTGRDLLARLVALAAAGDHDAALVVTAALTAKMARAERKCASAWSGMVSYDMLPAWVWQSVVTERRPDRPFLRERIEQVAWGSLWREIRHSRREITMDEFHHDTEDAETSKELRRAMCERSPTVDETVSTVAVGQLLDRLAATGRLTGRGRRIVKNLAAGGTGLVADRDRTPRAAAQERLRVVTRLRGDPHVRVALAA